VKTFAVLDPWSVAGIDRIFASLVEAQLTRTVLEIDQKRLMPKLNRPPLGVANGAGWMNGVLAQAGLHGAPRPRLGDKLQRRARSGWVTVFGSRI
jgi:hypothetical protein